LGTLLLLKDQPSSCTVLWVASACTDHILRETKGTKEDNNTTPKQNQNTIPSQTKEGQWNPCIPVPAERPALRITFPYLILYSDGVHEGIIENARM